MAETTGAAEVELQANNKAVAQCQIWTVGNNVLKETLWEGAGYKTLKSYIKAIVNESERALKAQGFSKSLYRDLPLCTFGILDQATGVTTVYLTCDGYDDLPSESVYQEILGEDVPLILFDKKK